jgi:glucokinase
MGEWLPDRVGAAHYGAMGDPLDTAGAPAGAVGAIGLDIGGTKIAVCIATGASERLEHRATASTRLDLGAESILDTADGLIEDALAVARSKAIAISGLGIAVPELVDTHGQIVSTAVVAGLRAIDLPARYAAFDVVAVESDVRAAAVAEARLGAGRSFESFGYISVGTGISHTFVKDGLPWQGARGGAILLGSSVMAEWQEENVPRRWVLEEIASGPALLERYRSLGGTGNSVRGVLDSYADDEAATRAVDEAAKALGIGLATLINLLDPEGVVIGGGLGTAQGPQFDIAVSSARAHIFSERARDIEIIRAECGEDSAVLGAAVIALRPAIA